MEVFRGETQYLLISAPPRYSKTELIVILFNSWAFVKNPRCQDIHLSYSDNLVMDNSQHIKDIINSFEFKRLWPHIKIKPNKDSKQAWDTVQGGSFYAAPAGGSVVGFGAGRVDEWDGETFNYSGAIFIDDPIKPQDSNSDLIRNKINSRWDEEIKHRRNSKRTPVIAFGQRVHAEDFSAMLLNQTEYKFKLLLLPALVDEDLPTEHALWPLKHTVEDLKAMKKANPWAFATQWQQCPTARGGNVIHSQDFKRYTVLPQIEYRIMYADTAMKEGDQHDFSVLQVWGYSKGAIYLLDQLRGKWDAPKLRDNAINFWNKHKAIQGMGTLRQFRIEDKASGTGLIQDLKNKNRIPVYAILRQGARLQRSTRVQDVLPQIEAGNVWIPEEAEWLSDFISECDAFTLDDNHSHDDQIDPMADAIHDMLSSRPLGIFDVLGKKR